jgi:hypothetical protein
MDQPQGIYQAPSDERRRGYRIQSLVPRYVSIEPVMDPADTQDDTDRDGTTLLSITTEKR